MSSVCQARTSVVLCLALSSVPGCNLEPPRIVESGAGIVNGRLSSLTAVVQIHALGNFVCSGSVLGEFVVLTANHCINALTLDGLEVWVGADPDTSRRCSGVVRIHTISSSFGPAARDIALHT